MVQDHMNSCRFSYLDNALFQPSKIKLVWRPRIIRKNISNSKSENWDQLHAEICLLELNNSKMR